MGEQIRKPGQTKTHPRMRMFVHRKAGFRVSEKLQKRIARFYPSVRLAWNYYFKRWVLLNRIAGGWEPIARLEDEHGGYLHPTERRVLAYLHKASTVNLRNKWGFEAWLRGLDSAAELHEQEMQRRASEQIREGSKGVYDALHNRIVVPQVKVPSNVKRPQPRRSQAVILGKKGGKVQWSRH